MATRFYYSMRYPPQWPLSPAHVSTSWDAGTWSYEGGVWVHIPRILTYGDFGRITTAKIPFGPDDPEHNQYNQREIYAQQGPNFAQGWYPCPNGPTCDPPFKVYAAQFFSDPLHAPRPLTATCWGRCSAQNVLRTGKAGGLFAVRRVIAAVA